MRAFVAFELPVALRQEIARQLEVRRREQPPARWVPQENYHLTLCFLGEVERSRVARVEARLADVFGQCHPFPLRLDGAGAFPPEGGMRVAWIGVEAPKDLFDLQRAVAEVCEEEFPNVRESRPYRPHLTVARCRRPWSRAARDRWCTTLEGPLGEPFTVREGVMLASRLRPSGARYEVRARWRMAAVS